MNLTWGQFKEIVEKEGATDDTEIEWIDMSGSVFKPEDLTVLIDEDGMVIY